MNFPPPTIRLHQDLSEFTQLLLIYQHFWPRRVLEIGSADGGTVWSWSHNGERGVQITAVSLFEQKDYKDPRLLFKKWEDECFCKITAINGDSHDPKVIEQMKANAPFDWIFIDGDHSADSVRTDYETCRSMAAHPSIIVLHDIGFPDGPNLQVGPLWDELSKTNNTTRIVRNPGTLGIGVLFLK